MPITRFAGQFAFGRLACSGSRSKDRASKSGVAHTLKGRGTTQSVVGNIAAVDRDVIVTPGTPITIALTQPSKIFAN